MTFRDKISVLTGIFTNYLAKSTILKDTVDEELFLRNAVLATIKAIDILTYKRNIRTPGFSYTKINNNEITLISGDVFQHSGIINKVGYSINITINANTIQLILSTMKSNQVKSGSTYVIDWDE